MVKTEASVMIDRPVEEVWKFISDISNPKKWKVDPNAIGARYTSTGPLGVGTTGEIIYPKQTLTLRYLEYEPNRKVTVEFTSGPINGTRATFVTETVEGKTKLTRTDDVKAAGFYKLMGPMVARRLKKIGEDDVAGIKRTLESEAHS
jgi:uncharacterized protein YndB with AHSA1/START domain